MQCDTVNFWGALHLDATGALSSPCPLTWSPFKNFKHTTGPGDFSCDGLAYCYLGGQLSAEATDVMPGYFPPADDNVL